MLLQKLREAMFGLKFDIESKRVVYEFPFFMLLVAVMHAGIKNIHDAFEKLIEDTMLSSLLREFSKLARLYKRIFSVERNYLTSLINLAREINNDLIRRFLYGYATAALVRGEAFNYIEDYAQQLPQRLEVHLKGSLELIGVIVEATIIISTIFVFILILGGLSSLITLVIPIAIMPLMMLLLIHRVPIAEIILPKPSRIDYIVFTLSIVFSSALLTLVINNIINVYEAFYISLIGPFIAGALIYRSQTSVQAAKQLLSVIASLSEILRIDAPASETALLNMLRNEIKSAKILSQVTYALKTGSVLNSGNSKANYALLSFFSSVISVIRRSGIYASRVASIAYSVITTLETSFRDSMRRALMFETILGLALLMLSLSLVVSAAILSSLNLSFVGNIASLVPLPSLSLTTVHKSICLLGLIAMIADIGLSHALRGSFSRSYLVPLIPLICISSIILGSSVNIMKLLLQAP